VPTLDVLLGQADRALYVSKQAGRNQASLFTPENFKV
jgi:PleD family two-component response regulator